MTVPEALQRVLDRAHGDDADLDAAEAELAALTTPRLSTQWIIVLGAGVDRHIAEFRLGGQVYRGESALPPGVRLEQADAVQRRRVELGALRALREQIIPTPPPPERDLG